MTHYGINTIDTNSKEAINTKEHAVTKIRRRRRRSRTME
jgi:hypothetical protein